jgi:hypothetical protein
MKVMLREVRMESLPPIEMEVMGNRFVQTVGPRMVSLTMTAVVVADELEEIRGDLYCGLCELRPILEGEKESEEVKTLLAYGRRKIMK